MTKYKCSECGAEDSDHQTYTSPPPALVCWNCKAGARASVIEQVQHQVGMLPENKQEE